MQDPMKFDKIGGGSFGQRLQAAFEQAQNISFQRNAKTEVSAKICIYPSDSPDHPEFGQVSYEVGVKQPAVVSPKFSTIIQGGRIVSDGMTIGDAAQTNLFEEEKGVENVRAEN